MNSHETNRSGRNLVENELIMRGAGSVQTVGTQQIRLRATSQDGSRTVIIKVKTKRKGNWHTSANEGIVVNTTAENEEQFWVFVEFDDEPKFWIVPDRWIRSNIQKTHEEYLREHGGHRPINDDSDHHSINNYRIQEWQNKWDLLEIF